MGQSVIGSGRAPTVNGDTWGSTPKKGTIMSDTQTREIAPTIPTKVDRSTWTLETYHEPIIDRGNGVVSRTLEVGGSGSGAADTLARQAVYESCENLTERLATAADANAKITVLRVGETFLGTPVAQIPQGSAFHS